MMSLALTLKLKYLTLILASDTVCCVTHFSQKMLLDLICLKCLDNVNEVRLVRSTVASVYTASSVSTMLIR